MKTIIITLHNYIRTASQVQDSLYFMKYIYKIFEFTYTQVNLASPRYIYPRKIEDHVIA